MSIRVWGRILGTTPGFVTGVSIAGGPAVLGPGSDGPVWVEVSTDAQGYNDYVYITALIQCLKLSVGESPFWADWGIAARQSVLQQVFPDYWVQLMQQRYAQYFASLQITKVSNPTPTYNVAIVTHQGVPVALSIPF